jgi:DUF1016 N-terminal domain
LIQLYSLKFSLGTNVLSDVAIIERRFSQKGWVRYVKTKKTLLIDAAYPKLIAQLVGLLERARVNSARSVNAVMTATYWEIGRRIAEQEQHGEKRAQYGKALLRRLAEDLTPRFGRGFSERNLLAMREFYRTWSIPQTPSAELTEPGIAAKIMRNPQTASAEIGPKPTARLQTSRGHRHWAKEIPRRKTLFGVDGGVRFKNDLTGPALLEMSGYATYQELRLIS